MQDLIQQLSPQQQAGLEQVGPLTGALCYGIALERCRVRGRVPTPCV
jgi:hypothetical protein